MKIDFNTVLLDIYGKPMQKPANLEGPPGDATLEWPCVEALLAPYADEKDLSGTEKAKRFALAIKLVGKRPNDVTPEDPSGTKVIDITPEEATMIKNLVAKAFPTYVVGLVWSIIDAA